MIVAYIALFAVLALIMGGSMAALSTGDMSGIGPGAIGMMILAYILLIVFGAYIAAVIESCMHRRMLGLQSGGFPFRLGQDEKNVFLAILGVYGIVFLISIAGVILAAIVGSILGMITPALAAIPMIIFYVFLIGFMVRLSPAGAMSVYAKRPVVLGALKVSKYRGWWIFLTYLLFIVALYAMLIALAFITVGPTVLMGGAMGDPTAITGLAGASGILLFAGMILIYLFSIPMMLGIGSYVVKKWAGATPNADVFS